MATDQKPQADTGPKPKRKKHRSPPFPFISLPAGIQRLEEFYAEEKHFHPVLISQAVTNWGYKPKSSGGLQTVGALKQFGLVEDEGSGPKRTIAVSDRGRRILLDSESPARSEAIKAAALSPRLHKELWEKWSGDLPSDATIKNYLLFERGFTPESATELIREFNETVEYANLSLSDLNLDEGSESDEEADVNTPNVATGDKKVAPKTTVPEGERTYLAIRLGAREFRLLGSGPEPTQKVWKKLIDHLSLNQDEFPEREPQEGE